MYFTKLRSMELKHGAVNHFCIQSYGNNLIIDNPITEAIIMQLNNEPDVAELFPYAVASVEVPQEQPATNLLKDVNLREIYDNSLVQEQQELGLDPIYVAECSIEPAKPRLQQAQYSPATAQKPMLAIISTYGACYVLMKNPYERLWREKVGNLTKLLMSDVFPINESPCDFKTFAKLKSFISLYLISACTWHSSGNIIYIANAAGFIVTFKVKFNKPVEDAVEMATWSFLSKIQTDIGRISYLKAFDDYLLAVSIDGVIRLFKTIEESRKEAEKLEFLETLWEQKDQMSCRQILVQKCKNDDSHLILYSKGAHVICMRITSEGKLEGYSSLYVPCIKITGLELFHENELIVTTITGHILRITFSCIQEKGSFVSLRLKADYVGTPNLDAENIQILGVGSTINKALWVFMTYRNKEMPGQSKQSVLPSSLILCKSSTVNSLEQLNNIAIDTNEPYQDLILALRMDVWHSNFFEKYETFSFPSQIREQMMTFDDKFLRKIQIQLEIARAALRRSSYKLQIVDEVISKEIEFLELAAQITHIMLRLEYLQSLIDNERILTDSAGFTILTKFQQRTAYSMRKNFNILIEKLKSSYDLRSNKDELNKLKELTLAFVELAIRNFRIKCQDFEIIDNSAHMEEKCLVCQECLNEQELICQLGHNLRRCCVSFVQLPWFNNQFCPQCETVAMDNHKALEELFPLSESVKCTFCRAIFVNKETI